MSTCPHLRRRRSWLVAGALAVITLAGCGLSSNSTTRHETTQVDGVGGRTGSISVEYAYLADSPGLSALAKGSNAQMYVAMFNNGTESDAFTGADCTNASACQSITVEVQSSASPSYVSPSIPAQTSPIPAPGGYPGSSPNSRPSSYVPPITPGASALSSPGAPVAPSAASPTPTSVPGLSNAAGGTGPVSLVLPPGQAVRLFPGSYALILHDLGQTLISGDTISVTLHFQRAGDLVLQVPVQTPDRYLPRPSATPSPGATQSFSPGPAP